MGIGGALAGVGFVGIIVAAFISPLTLEGLHQAAAWNSFAGYLRAVTQGKAPVTSPDMFERYLPYAAGLGLATGWAKTFQKMEDILVPAWFQGLQPGLTDGSFVAVIAAVSAADSSASTAAGAGSSASGGGASGAG
jgi:uncharacterized membrane protein